MEPCIKIISQLMYSQIFSGTSKSEADLRAWLANRDYSIVKNITSSSFTLLHKSEYNFFTALANDCNRMSQASFETISSIQPNLQLPKSLAWCVIQTYYAAFFAAHAILRLFGWSCSQLEADHVLKVLELAQLTSCDANINQISCGFYVAKYDRKTRHVAFEKVKDSHADTWASFSSLLFELFDQIQDYTVGISKHKLDAMDILSDLRQRLTQNGSCSRGNWLSVMRNDINYKHSHGVWFPYPSADFKRQSAFRNDLWQQPLSSFDLSPKQSRIDTFFSVSNTIIALLYGLVSCGYNLSQHDSYNFSNGTIKMLNLIGVGAFHPLRENNSLR
jgi:uncharacterized protein (UPF0332 family)